MFKARDEALGEQLEQAHIDLAHNEIDNFHVEEQFDVSAMAGPRQALMEALGLCSRQLALTKRSVLDLQDSVLLWQHMVKGRIGAMDLSEQAQGWKNLLKGYLQRLWAFELLSVEDTIVVDGASVLEKRPVTFGKMIQALLILFFGLLVASLMARLISRLVFPFSTIHEQRRHLIQKLLRVVMVVVVVILALVTVKIPLTVFAFLGGAIAIGIGFGAQNLLNNFISGFILLGENQIRVGDRIEIENNEGIVKSIGDRCTRVRRLDGVEILIPNSQLLERSVTNMTLSDRHIRKSIAIGVAYGSPTRKVQELLLEIVKSHHPVVVDPEPAVVFEDFGDNALLFNAYFWLDFAPQERLPGDDQRTAAHHQQTLRRTRYRYCLPSARCAPRHFPTHCRPLFHSTLKERQPAPVPPPRRHARCRPLRRHVQNKAQTTASEPQSVLLGISLIDWPGFDRSHEKSEVFSPGLLSSFDKLSCSSNHYRIPLISIVKKNYFTAFSPSTSVDLSTKDAHDETTISPACRGSFAVPRKRARRRRLHPA